MLPSELYSAAQVRALDAESIETHGIPGAVLMERAGRCAYRTLRARWPSARCVHVVCGAGNNGGDGFVLARLARADGLDVVTHLLGDMTSLGNDARSMFGQLTASGAHPIPFSVSRLAPAEVIVDAVFGTGLGREVAGGWRAAIEAMNDASAPVLAIDLPSGLHADTGRVLGAAVRARATVTFIGLKRGLFTGEGPARCGDLVFDDLSVPAAVFQTVTSDVRRIDRTLLADLAPRSRTAHKGSHGHVLILGGEAGFAGAARLAGEAAARTGAGLVSVGTREQHAGWVNIACPELMVRGVESDQALRELAARASVIAVGPGLGTNTWGGMILESALGLQRPTVVDADGLNLLAARPSYNEHWILTPHPAEAGRLLGVPTTEVQDDRFAAVRLIAERYGGICVLKGAGTLIAGAGESLALCSAGNPGLATGGTGDVLTGVIAAFLAQGHGLGEAARLGVTAHAAAGDVAAAAGERGMLASDVLGALRSVVNPASS